MKFAILGSGNGARAWGAQLAAKGYDTVMWEPLENVPDFPKLQAKPTLKLEGDIQLSGRLNSVTMDIAEAMRGANYILVIVPAFAHNPIFKKMIPCLEDGQHIIIVPDNFGSYRLRQMMLDCGCSKKISISATETMPYACRMTQFDTVTIFKRKFKIHLATSPFSAKDEILAQMNEAFAGYVEFCALEHMLAAPLANPNYVMHPYPLMLNYGEIEKNGDTFRHYIDGVTPLIAEQMARLDEERVDIGQALGFHLHPILELMKLYYGHNESKDLYEYTHSPESPYTDLIGQSVRSRYITEDVPGVIMPAVCLAQKAGLEAPRSSLIVTFCSQLHGVDYWTGGTTLESLGLGQKSIQEIMDMMA